jgi:predicted membrane protein
VIQICLGTLAPLILLFLTQVVKFNEIVRKRLYVISGSLALIGVLAMRWNVVIGGQLFSKSFLGYTTYKMGLVTREGLLVAIALTLLPLVFLWALVKLLPPWPEKSANAPASGD